MSKENVGTGNHIIPVYPGDDRSMGSKLWNATKELLELKGVIE